MASLSQAQFQILMWTFSALAATALVSRFAIRFCTKGRLMVNDYFLVAALPVIFVGAGLVQYSLRTLYLLEEPTTGPTKIDQVNPAGCLVAAQEMLWITIYCVKFSFLGAFKFHKPPYAYVSAALTRHYWFSVGICVVMFLFTLTEPIILCPNNGNCRYLKPSHHVFLDMFVTGVDILTDLFVLSIPALILHMTHMTRSQTAIFASFKCLSVIMVGIAIARLVLQYDSHNHRIHYVWNTFWIFMEAAVALVMASVSSYRYVFFDTNGRPLKRKEPKVPPQPVAESSIRLVDILD